MQKEILCGGDRSPQLELRPLTLAKLGAIEIKGGCVYRLCLILPLLFLGPDIMPGEQLPIRTYTTPEGLAHNHINRIRQDSRGYLWFCTDGGLSRFDGYRFANYTTEDGLPHPWVNDLLETRDGAYWIATDGGVCRFNPNGSSGKSGRPASKPMFVVYKPGAEEDANRINALAEDPAGSIWCGAYGGLYRLQRSAQNVAFESVDIGQPRNAYLGQLVNNIAVDGSGALWIAARHGLAVSFRSLPGRRRPGHRAGQPDLGNGVRSGVQPRDQHVQRHGDHYEYQRLDDQRTISGRAHIVDERRDTGERYKYFWRRSVSDRPGGGQPGAQQVGYGECAVQQSVVGEDQLHAGDLFGELSVICVHLHLFLPRGFSAPRARRRPVRLSMR
jgi:hypothetical protein